MTLTRAGLATIVGAHTHWYVFAQRSMFEGVFVGAGQVR
jgi:hypothetical protein